VRDLFFIVLLQVAWAMIRWWLNKAERDLRAAEIVALLKKISKDGDILADQIAVEMNRKSGVGWNEIETRS
jgi:hypothetical protein